MVPSLVFDFKHFNLAQKTSSNFENEERIYNLFGFTHDCDPTMEVDINFMKTKLLELNPRLWSMWDTAH